MKICIVGTGTMGHGIAQVFAQAGHEVLLKGRSEASLAKAHKAMDKNLSRMVEKGKLEAGVKDQVLARIKDTMKYEDCADADLVIEAIAEDMATKHEIFKLLDGICKANGKYYFFAGTTSFRKQGTVIRVYFILAQVNNL